MKLIKIYTDGACRGNPGPGGWGALLHYSDKEKTIHGSDVKTTNNRMELTAAIQALLLLKEPCKVILTTDSQYLRRGMIEWLPGWRKNSWRKKDNSPIINLDLWQQLDKLAGIHQIDWRWVKGHSGHPENDRADQLANLAIDLLLGLKK